MMRYFLPAFIGILTLGIWEIWVALANIPLRLTRTNGNIRCPSGKCQYAVRHLQ